jgi:hypothetical protein
LVFDQSFLFCSFLCVVGRLSDLLIVESVPKRLHKQQQHWPVRQRLTTARARRLSRRMQDWLTQWRWTVLLLLRVRVTRKWYVEATHDGGKIEI